METSREQRAAVARDECRRHGHRFRESLVLSSLAPRQVSCANCGALWRIHPEDTHDFVPGDRTAGPADLANWPASFPENWHDLVAETLELAGLGEGSESAAVCFDPEFHKTVARDLRDRLFGRSPTYAQRPQP